MHKNAQSEEFSDRAFHCKYTVSFLHDKTISFHAADVISSVEYPESVPLLFD